MSNVTPIRQTRRVNVTVHRVTFDLVPRAVVEELFYAAISVAWAAGDGEFTSDDAEAMDRMEALQKAVSAASQYAVPVEREVEEPI